MKEVICMKKDNTYQVMRIDSRQKDWWKEAQAAQVTYFPWGGDYRPVTSTRLGIDGESLFVYMETD